MRSSGSTAEQDPASPSAAAALLFAWPHVPTLLSGSLGTQPPERLATAAPSSRWWTVGASLSTLSVWLNSQGSTGPTGEHFPVTDPTLTEAQAGRVSDGYECGGDGEDAVGAHLRW